MNTKQKVLKELRAQPRRAAAAGCWEPRVTWSCLYYSMGCPWCGGPGVFIAMGQFYLTLQGFGVCLFCFFFAICRSRNKCDMCGLLTTLQSQSRGLSDDPVTPGGHESSAKHSATQITQEPESSGSNQTRVSPRGSTRDPLLSCCPLIPLVVSLFLWSVDVEMKIWELK